MKGLTDKITLIDREKAQNKLDLETAQAALGSINADLGSAGASIADSSTVQALSLIHILLYSLLA